MKEYHVSNGSVKIADVYVTDKSENDFNFKVFEISFVELTPILNADYSVIRLTHIIDENADDVQTIHHILSLNIGVSNLKID